MTARKYRILISTVHTHANMTRVSFSIANVTTRWRSLIARARGNSFLDLWLPSLKLNVVYVLDVKTPAELEAGVRAEAIKLIRDRHEKVTVTTELNNFTVTVEPEETEGAD